MIDKHYLLESNSEKDFFFFKSTGVKGSIEKWVWFQKIGKDRYNLAFGDLINGELSDSSISNNLDVLMVISTVAKTIYEFSELHPDVTIIIIPRDEKLKRFYNTVFRRRYQEIIELFDILGIKKHIPTSYNPKKNYDKFELTPKTT